MSKHHKLLTMYFLKEREGCASLNRLGEPLGTDYQAAIQMDATESVAVLN